MKFTQERLRGFIDTAINQNIVCYDNGHDQGLITPELIGMMYQIQHKSLQESTVEPIREVYLAPDWAYTAGLSDEEDFVYLENAVYTDMLNYYTSSGGNLPENKNNIMIALLVDLCDNVKSVMLGAF